MCGKLHAYLGIIILCAINVLQEVVTHPTSLPTHRCGGREPRDSLLNPIADTDFQRIVCSGFQIRQ